MGTCIVTHAYLLINYPTGRLLAAERSEHGDDQDKRGLGLLGV